VLPVPGAVLRAGDGLNLAWLLFPLIVIGMNSIAAYCMDWLFAGFIRGALDTHLETEFLRLFGEPFEPLWRGVWVLAAFWLILLWMYRRRLFLKI